MNRIQTAFLSKRRLPPVRLTALLILLTGTATWLWAHAGHLPLPTRGAVVDAARGRINLSRSARVALDVRTDAVALGALEEQFVAHATLVAPWQRYALATSQLAGKIVAVRVQGGDRVAQGQALAEVHSLELENLQLDLLTAQNTARLSAKNLQRLEELFQQGSTSEKSVSEEQSHHQQNLHALQIARLKLLALGVDEAVVKRLLDTAGAQRLSMLSITSPIAGVVTRADVQVGQVVDPADHLFEVVDLSTLWVKAEVLEGDLPRIEVGQAVEVRLAAFPGEVFRSAVQVKGLALDPASRQGVVWAELANPPGQRARLLPGMHGQIEFLVAAPHQAVTVPAAAVLRDGAERYVLVEEGPGQYSRENVVTGRQAKGLVEMRAGGLVPGDQVVTVGGHELATFLGHNVLRLSPEAARNIGLVVEPARRQAVADVLYLSAAVELSPQRQAVAFSRLAGTIRRIRVDRDQMVQAGEVIAEVASPEFQDLQLELLRNHLQLQLLEQTLQRTRPLAAAGAFPERTLRETESAYRATRERRDSVQRKLEAVGLSRSQVQEILDRQQFLDALPVKAPIGGAVVRFQAALGHAVKADHPLFEIHDLARPLVRGYVSDRQLAAVRVGQKARVRLLADPGAEAVGFVVRSGQTFGTEDRTLSVWVELTKEPRPRWLPGMLARITLVVSEPEAVLAVPRAAVLREGTSAYLFVRGADGTFERRPVTTGRSDDRWLAIPAGLREGEEVAVQGVADLQTSYATIK